MTEIFGKIKNQIQQSSGGSSLLEVSGNGEMLISGCVGIGEYNCNEITVHTVLGDIAVIGEKLRLEVYRGDVMSVKGRVNLIRLGGKS